MDAIGTLVTVLCAILVGIGSFLLSDGYRGHKIVGLVSEVLGWGWFVVSNVIGAQRAASGALSCSIYGEGCPDYAGVPDGLVLGVLWFLWIAVRPFAVEGLVMMAATGAGWGVARLTRRRPG